jgi:Zn-dependent peptidase ImmA (M78 family)/transcriptional regulator with XRE-family HTH domain
MRYEELPVTPAVIKWARVRAGVTVEEASKTFKRIEAWEDGQSLPTYPQLEQLAEAFKVPVAVFFFPEPPEMPSISQTFRTLPEAQLDQIPSRIQLLLRKAKALQLNLMELTGARNFSERLITRDLAFTSDMTLAEMTRTVRDYLGVSLEDQKELSDDEAALKRWRQAFFDAGIYVFKDAFRVEDYSGFCLYDDIFPIIYVNNSAAKTRQIFTLFHELAHLLFHTSGIDTANSEYIPRLKGEARKIEILCNRFAAEFLLPEDAFATAARHFPPTGATAERIAATFHVSREMIFRRFLDRRLIDQETYAAAAERWAEQHQAGGSGGDYYWTKLSYLGRDYVALALSQYRQNRISESQLADYLDTKPKNLVSLEQYFDRSAA